MESHMLRLRSTNKKYKKKRNWAKLNKKCTFFPLSLWIRPNIHIAYWILDLTNIETPPQLSRFYFRCFFFHLQNRSVEWKLTHNSIFTATQTPQNLIQVSAYFHRWFDIQCVDLFCGSSIHIHDYIRTIVCCTCMETYRTDMIYFSFSAFRKQISYVDHISNA